MYSRSNERVNYFNYLSRSVFQSASSPYFFGYGRTALKAGLSAYNIPVGKKILVPNYICDAALQPFHELGLGTVYYSVNPDLTPDWKSVNENLSPEIFAILMVHYFGIPQDIEQFQGFAKENNLLLIEDNSHGHGSLYAGKIVGTFGDIGISSPRKSFPILNGGVLFLKSKNISLNDHFPLEYFNIPQLIIRDITGRILDSFTSVKEFFLKKFDNGIEWNTAVEDWSIDRVSFNTLMKYDLKTVRELRTNIYLVWEKWAKSNNLTPVFSLKDNTSSPLSMPIIFNNKIDRDKWQSILKKNHIAGYLWPDLPKELQVIDNSGKDLFDRILCTPIHLAMNTQELEKFLNTLNY